MEILPGKWQCRGLSYSMNSRELALVSTAAVFGALASALTCRFFFSNPKRQSPKLDLSRNGAVSGKCSSQSPFDPSKREGLVSKFPIFHKIPLILVRLLCCSNKNMGNQLQMFTKMVNFHSYYCCVFNLQLYSFVLIADIYHGMIISWQLHFYQLKDPKIPIGRSYSLLYFYMHADEFVNKWGGIKFFEN